MAAGKQTSGKPGAPAGKTVAKSPGSGVVKREEPKDNLPTVQYDEEDYGSGFEDMGAADLAIPFLAILQKGSPQVDEEKEAYIDGAKPGMILNTVTQEVYDGKGEGILFVPVHRVHNYVEWVPRDSGGGFVAVHEVESPMIIQARKHGAFGKLASPDENDLVETFSVFGLLVHEDGSFDSAIIAFSSTQIKHYKRWMTTARGIMVRSPQGKRVNPPLFAHVYRLKTKGEQNTKGSWHGWDIKFEGGNAATARLEQDNDVYQAAKGLRDLVTSGQARAAYNTAQDDTATGGGDEDEY
jgi:hypothetical protein